MSAFTDEATQRRSHRCRCHGLDVGAAERAARYPLQLTPALCAGGVRPRHQRTSWCRGSRPRVHRLAEVASWWPVRWGLPGELSLERRLLSSALAGAGDARTHVQNMVANCPNTRMVLGGYSQGAGLIDSTTDQLAPQVADHVAAVAVFGNPESTLARTLAGGQLPDHQRGVPAQNR